MSVRILLTHSRHARATYYGAEPLAALDACGEVVANPHDRPLRPDEVLALARGCAIIVADRQVPFPAAVLEDLPDLVALLRCAVDISTIDVAAASRNGILVTRASAGFADAVAELALGLMIDLARGVTAAAQAYRGGRTPEVRPGIQLSASRVGIVGYGTIGRRLAALCRSLGMEVLVADPLAEVEAGLRQVPLPTLLAQATFVVLLAPARPETEGLMDGAAFAAMGRGSYFLNLSRSRLVDEAALAAALDRGHLAGAALDVGSAPDEMPPPALARRPDVIATPHIGGLTPQATQHQAFDTVRQAVALLAGRMPQGAVNAGSAARLAAWRLALTAM